MEDSIKQLRGSEKRDAFKWAHKNKIDHPFYASDADLCLVTNKPIPGVVAYLDYKGSDEDITFSEIILYDEWTLTKPVYIVRGKDPESGPFDIFLYETGGSLIFVMKVVDWGEFTTWEAQIRRDYSNNGWIAARLP